MTFFTRSAMAALCLAVMALQSAALAHSPRPPEAGATQAPPPRQGGGRPLQFDWLANRPDPAARAPRPSARQMRAPGHGTYICSAAGFGAMSRCTER